MAEPLLRPGSRGPAVVDLQTRLSSVGFDPGPIDGIFGPLTEQAVVGFQKVRSIQVDGIVGPQTRGELPTSRVRVHIKIVQAPNISIDAMVNAARETYVTGRMGFEVASTETLTVPPDLFDLDVGACAGTATSAEQGQIFTNLNNVGTNEIVVYFVRSVLDDTGGPLNGCATHPAGVPGAVVAAVASQFTLGHEIGHVLDLGHVNNADQLMTGGGTNNITNPPPDIDAGEIATMQASPSTIDF